MRKNGLVRIVVVATLLSALCLAPRLPGGPAWALAADDGPDKATLLVTDNLARDGQNIVIETVDWRVVFGLLYNGGIYEIYDKVLDPEMKDNLVQGPGTTQGGLFDYNVYLLGNKEFMTTFGKNEKIGRTSLTVLENNPVRVRLRQICHPRLNSGDGPSDDRFLELDMVETITEWTIYATGRVSIKFDAVHPKDWKGVISSGPGGDGPGVSAKGNLVKGLNGALFNQPWVAAGDTIESKAGGWGPLEIQGKQSKSVLRVDGTLPEGDKLDYVIKRPYITNETISIHGDGGVKKFPQASAWQGGSNAVPVFSQGVTGNVFRGGMPSLQEDYVYAHWTRAPRGYGSLLVFNEPYAEASYAVMNDTSWGDISYTQVGCGRKRPFAPHHRHFLAQIGIENAKHTPRIKGIPDALPFADDYRRPYAQARVGTLAKDAGPAAYGFDLVTGAYRIVAKNNVAAIAFDSARGAKTGRPLAYQSPAVLVTGINVPDAKLRVELSIDNGKTFKLLDGTAYNVSAAADVKQLGGANRRLCQLLLTVPVEATGAKAWVLRFR